jgi:hypothetical protein
MLRPECVVWVAGDGGSVVGAVMAQVALAEGMNVMLQQSATFNM